MTKFGVMGLFSILGFGLILFYLINMEYRVKSMEPKEIAGGSQMKKVGFIKTQSGLSIEIFELTTQEVRCFIPVQTQNKVYGQKLVDRVSFAPTLSCTHR
jgi:uncharacterized membrane protein